MNHKGFQPPAEPVTIVVVTYNSSATIDRCLGALANNTPEACEIVIVDNASKDETCAKAEGHASKLNLKLVQNTTNLGFSKACNQGIEASRGADPNRGFVILLNPDTVVTPGWLPRLLRPLRGGVGATGPLSNYVAALQKYELYLNKIAGPRPSDLLQLSNALAEANAGNAVDTKLLIGFCLAMRRDLIEKHGGLDENLFLGNDDLEYSHRLRKLGYKLQIATDCFVYHEGQKSFESLAVSERDRLVQESTNALRGKLEKIYGKDGVPSPMELWGVDWFLPELTNPLVSIVIPVWNNLQFTSTCLRSIAGYTGVSHEVIVIDNGSTDGTPQFLATQKHVRVIRNDKNLGFAAASNQGMSAARGKHIVLLNNDVVLTPRWLDGLLECAKSNPQIGIVGPRTNFAAGAQQIANATYRSLGELEAFSVNYRNEHRREWQTAPRIIGLCMLITDKCYKAVGLLDERFGIGNFEDDDYCVRARLAGFQCMIAGDVFVHHFGSQTFKLLGINFGELLDQNRQKFLDKWKELLPAKDEVAAGK
ncbi:MAG: glycosyltransferase [Planctomycetota bacterium]